MCDQFLDQIRELKSTRREKCRELVQLEAKEKRAKCYRALRTATTTSRSVSPVTDHTSSITITPTTTSRTPTPTPHSPIGNSAKAALSRKQKASKETQEARPQIYRCGVCHAMFEEETQEEELWVGCEYCDGWFHAVCVNIDLQCVPEEFVCQFCK